MTQLKDFQLAKFIVSSTEVSNSIDSDHTLEIEIEVKNSGKNDSVEFNGDVLVLHSPTSVAKSTFNLIYQVLASFVNEEHLKDRLALLVSQASYEYIYNDADKPEISPALSTNSQKNHTINTIISEIVEPVLGRRISSIPVVKMPCPFTETCRIVDSPEHFRRFYGITTVPIDARDYPVVLSNTRVLNTAAADVHLLWCILNTGIGEQRATKLIGSVLLDETRYSLVDAVVDITYLYNGSAKYVSDFLSLLSAHGRFAKEDSLKTKRIQLAACERNSVLQGHIKLAQKYTPSVNNQWSQWAMLVGITEKQLGATRGPDWPVSKAMKPHDDRFQVLLADKVQKKREKGSKDRLNFEELLEVNRQMYNKKAIEPGMLYEHLLGDARIW